MCSLLDLDPIHVCKIELEFGIKILIETKKLIKE